MKNRVHMGVWKYTRSEYATKCSAMRAGNKLIVRRYEEWELVTCLMCLKHKPQGEK